jgi:hypothetical protein
MVKAITQPTITVASKEYSKLIFGILGAVTIAIISIGVVVFVPSNLARMLTIPPLAYLVSLLISFIFQSSVCPSVNMTSAAIMNITILLSTGLASFILFLESIPILALFGYTQPINPLTGLPISRESSPEEYATATDDNKHLKIQFFSGIVKAVIPVYFDEINKMALVYLYWMFWMALLPLYTILGIQGVC